ncbi:MAG: DEAD/DEAH box helicase [Acidimicrobiia bacterium]|nr:DEAD/DEAH box helicase [Acidimicrobiia bacterium]MDH5293860.1 DEAD/DEAH box helicase [Acidimicrobiia bacterium]
MNGTRHLEEFLTQLPYAADPFQHEAGEALASGRGVVVTAPTGAGKTLVAEIAIHLAVTAGRKVFYTTPIKALSNQKFGDLIGRYGSDRVGLLTGDNVINGGAEIVVMTTEVLRNMIYTDAEVVDAVEFVILDEVHYLQDRFRGAVWEEILIHAPPHVKMVALSATIANADEFAAWIAERRGDTVLIVEEERPVPLESLYLVADRAGTQRLHLLPMFSGDARKNRPNPRLDRLLNLGKKNRFTTPGRVEIVEMLQEENLLPAIYFVFSRAGCDGAALSLTESGLRLVDGDARDRIRSIAEEHTAHLSDADLSALDYGRWITTLECGIAAHHAGMVPAFKETVEELFASGLLKVVFATETLALGINMPARTVVLDSLSKFDGEGHAMLEPGDYTQLTGRAGRRGIDTRGYGVVLHSRFVRLDQVQRIASTGSHPLRSSFRPTYNMAVNLVANYSEERALELLDASFAQFQRESAGLSAQRTLENLQQKEIDERSRAQCELGSVEEYAALLDKSNTSQARSLAGRLHPGDVIDIPAGSRAGRYVVLRRVARGKKGVRHLVLGTSGRTSTIGEHEVVPGTAVSGSVHFPRDFRGQDRKFNQVVLRQLRAIPPAGKARPELPPTTRPDHPVAACRDAESHVRWLRKARRTAKRINQLRSDLRRQGVGLVDEFNSIRSLLTEWSYLDSWELTGRGERLRFLYNEMDLLLTESIERGLLWNLDSAELAAFLSCFVYEPRSDQPSEPAWPTTTLTDRFATLERLSDELAGAERLHRLPPSRRPDPGFVEAAHAWASGKELDAVPIPDRLAAGDFVRICRQLVDLVRQVRDVVSELSDDARAALAAVDRGVVAAQGAA